MNFCHLLIFSKSSFLKISFKNVLRLSNSLDPDHAGHCVGHDPGHKMIARVIGRRHCLVKS